MRTEAALPPRTCPPARRRGFTLLELMVAFAILALFVLPMLEIVAASRVRALKYTRERVMRDLAQRKLFDCIYYLEEARAGTFDAEGYPDWTWEVPPPQVMSQGEHALLQYTIRVATPQAEAPGRGGGSGGSFSAAFEMSAWTVPSRGWYEEQALLEAEGYESQLQGGMGLPGAGRGY